MMSFFKNDKKVKELEDEVQKETRLMYKYKGWVSKKQNALMNIAENLQAETDKQDTITT